MASFDTSKIVSDIKAGKITSKEPPKYIFVKNSRNNKKTKKLNPRWTAWSKRQRNKKIDKDVETYVKKNQKGQKINKDLTKDFSKKKESGIGPIREGNKYSNKLKANKKNDNSSTVDKGTNKTNGNTNGNTNGSNTENKKEAPKKKTTREKFNEKFIKTKGGRLAKRGTVGARGAENRERARKRAQAAAKLRIKKKKKNNS